MFSQFGASPISLFGANTTMKPLATSQAIATSGAAGGRCYDFDAYGMDYFLKGALAGGLCCSLTHGGLVPVDVVKTRIQLDPAKYNQGMVGGFKQIIAEEGSGALASGFGPTAVGYFIQGWFKFGGVEFFKINFTKSLGDETAWNNKTGIYLLSAACAEFIADIFLCPLEATRIRLVSQPDFGSGLMDAAPKIMQQDGFMKGFYSGFGPILFKQVPYTMAKFAVQGKAQDMTCATMVSISKRRRARVMESTVVDNFYSSLLFSNLFHCLCHVLLYSKTPKQVFFF